jgi:hypothetical protein
VPKIDWEALTYETNLAQAVAEWHKKFHGTYVWLNQKHILFVMESDTNFLYFIDKNGAQVKVKTTTENDVDVAFPTVGLFNHEDSFLLFKRVPARQYKKAPCPGNSIIINPLGFIKGERDIKDLDFDILEAAFKARYCSFDVAIAGLNLKAIKGAALSSKWGVSIHPKGSQHLLWYHEYPVAEIHEDKLHVKVPSFRQEISDFIRDNKIALEIVV